MDPSAPGRLCSWNLSKRCMKEGLFMVWVEFNGSAPECQGNPLEVEKKLG